MYKYLQETHKRFHPFIILQSAHKQMPLDRTVLI